jgi:hypothetical protein
VVTTQEAERVHALLSFALFLDGELRTEAIEEMCGPRLIRYLGDTLAHEFLFLESTGASFWGRYGTIIEELRPEPWDAMVAEPDEVRRCAHRLHSKTGD